MTYVKIFTYHVPVLDVRQCSTNIGIYGIKSKKQARYQPVTNCTYWPVLGSYKICNIVELTPKSTPFEAFDEINKVVLDKISENMASLVQSGMYGAINTDNTTENRFYVIKFLSEAYTLHYNTTIDVKVISSGELVSKVRYLCSMQENTNLELKKKTTATYHYSPNTHNNSSMS